MLADITRAADRIRAAERIIARDRLALYRTMVRAVYTGECTPIMVMNAAGRHNSYWAKIRDQVAERAVVCVLDDCENPHERLGLCVDHAALSRRGFRESRTGNRPRECTIPDCERTYAASGYCDAHYRRYQRGARGEALTKPIKRRG